MWIKVPVNNMAEATGPVSIKLHLHFPFPSLSCLYALTHHFYSPSPVFLQNGFIKIKQKEKITVIQKGETQMNITKYSAKDYKGKKKISARE